jgi:ABC-type branched-subunit amino acid transport system ATPase component
MTLLQLRGVSRRFGGVLAVNDLDLDVEPGTIHGLIGPNGSGKTTALNVISGYYRPSSGQVRFDSQDISRLPSHAIARRGLARTFQNLRLFRAMSVLDNVLVPMQAIGRASFLDVVLRPARARSDDAAARIRGRELLRLLDVEQVADLPARALPYGMQRRVEIARALAGSPRLLLLDEPAAGLNPSEIGALERILRQLQAQGLTILLIEHHVRLVMAICNRITVLNYGQKIGEGPPSSVSRDPHVIHAYLGDEAGP